MIKLTFEADSLIELLEDIGDFVELRGELQTDAAPPKAAVISSIVSSNETAPEKEKKTRKSKKSSPDTVSAPALVHDDSTKLTPLAQSNAEHTDRNLDEAAPATGNLKIYAYQDLSKAVMEVVKKFDKPKALSILRTFSHKDGGDLVVNSPMDIDPLNYAKVIAKMEEAVKEEKAA